MAAAGIAGLVCAVLTAALFFLLTLPGERLPADWLALGWALFAELFSAASALTLLGRGQGARRLLLLSRGLPALSAYALLAAGFAAAAVHSRLPFRIILVTELLGLGCIVTVIFLIRLRATRLLEADSAAAYAVTAVGGLVGRAASLCKANRGAPFAKALEILYDALRCADNTVMVPSDREIHRGLYDLETALTSGREPDGEEVLNLITLLLENVAQRNSEASRLKVKP
jgi:hypothetical protein